MRSITCLLVLIFSPIALAEVVRLSEPVEITADYEVFGSPMEDISPGMGLKDIVANQKELNGKVVRVTTRVAQVCQKKGCFFIATEGDTWARVTFANYEVFVPTDSSGKEVTLEGTFVRRKLTAEQAAHYAADIGKEGAEIVGPQFEYGIVATSVLLPKT